MWKCKNCGTEFEGKFCPECGTKWEEQICPQCGTVLPAHAKFCPECGAKWEGGKAAGNARGEIHSAPAEPRYEEAYGGGGDGRPTPLPPIAEKGSGNHMVAFPESPKEGSREGAYKKDSREEEADRGKEKIRSAPSEPRYEETSSPAEPRYEKTSSPAEPRYEEPLEGDTESETMRGQREDAENGAYGKRENVFAFFTEERLRKIYRALAIVPAAMCAFFSFLLFMFCLAPSAEMLDIFMGGTTSIGNVYDLSDASSQTIITFASIGLLLAGIAFLFLFVPKLKWREIPFRHIPVWGALSVLTFAVYFAPFVAACAICADVAETDDGLGVLEVGAGPILIIVFSLLFLLMLGGIWCTRYFISRKYPAFAAEEKGARAALAKEYEIPKPEETTQFVMRLRTAMRKKTFLRWSIPFTVISSCLLAVFVGFSISDRNNGNGVINNWLGDTIIFWVAFAVLTLGIGAFCFGILRSKKVRIPSLDLQTTLKKSQKWFRGACVAYTIVGTIVLGLLITAWLTAFQGSIDQLSLEASWLRGFLLFVTVVIVAVTLLDIALSFGGRRDIKQIGNYIRTREQTEEIDLHTINDVPEERRAKVLRRGFPAAVVAGLLLMTILVVSGVGYSIFSAYKLDKIDVGDPYTTVTRAIGNPNEGRDTTRWAYYSEEYLSLARRSEELQKQLENAKTEEELLEIGNKMNELAYELERAEYRCIVVNFTADGFVTSVTMYRVYYKGQQVIYDNHSQ